MGAEQVLAWEGLITNAVGLGVKSWSVIHAAMIDAGVAADDAAISDLQAKFDALWTDVNRAAGN
jgi:hypothetical protein